MNTNKQSGPGRDDAPAAIKWIMRLVVAWGFLLAAGVYWYVDPRVMRIRPAAAAIIVLACTSGFVGFWMAALRMRRRKVQTPEPPAGDQVDQPPPDTRRSPR